MPGFAYMGQCYGQKQDALDAFAASAFPRVRDQAGCTYLQSADTSTGQLVVGTSTGSTTCPAVPAETLALEFVSCDPLTWAGDPFALSYTDAGFITSAVLGVWFIAWAWKAAYRALGTDSPPSEG